MLALLHADMNFDWLIEPRDLIIGLSKLYALNRSHPPNNHHRTLLSCNSKESVLHLDNNNWQPT